MTQKGSERIAKRLARAGLCSRREGERWIYEGRVTVDGTVLTSPAMTVSIHSSIKVDGKLIPTPTEPRLWLYHKPCGLLTTHRDPQGRPTVFNSLPAELPRMISVGRLDINSEGLLLLTNNGDLARRLELPGTGLLRRYRARVRGILDGSELETLKKGIIVNGVHYGPIFATLDRQLRRNAWLSLTLREGKNREVRRVLNHLGLDVSRLIRIGYGPFQLGKLAPRGLAEIPPQRIQRYTSSP